MSKKIWFICLILSMAIAAASVTPISHVSAVGVSAYDYSATGVSSDYRKSIDAASVADMLGVRLTDEERNYTKNYCDIKFSYGINNGLGTDKDLGISVKSTGSGYEITAPAKEFKAKNGATLVCVPSSISYGNNEVKFVADGASYICDLVEKKDKFDINYSISTVISVSQANEITNYAINEAKYAANVNSEYSVYKNKKLAYEQYAERLASYNLQLKAFEAYSDYLEKKQIYDEYLLQKKEYDERVAAYEAACAEYEKQLTKYEEDLLGYNAALSAYNKYLEQKKVYDERMAEYMIYESKMELIKHRVTALDSIFVKMTSLNRDVYSAVMGSSVTTVLNAFLDNAAAMEVALGKEVVGVAALAKETTVTVRRIFAEYKECETLQQKYAYYCANYDLIVTQICKLTSYLEYFWQNFHIRQMVRAQNTDQDPAKDKKYIILLAQLILISNLLSDEPVLSYDKTRTFDLQKTTILYEIRKSESVNKNLTIREILENEFNNYPVGTSQIPTVTVDDDNCAKPKEGEAAFPEAVKLPDAPLNVEKPALPTLPKPPNDDRGMEPIEVDRPVEQPYAEHPGEQPAEVEDPTSDKYATARFYALDKVVAQLADGKINERDFLSSSEDSRQVVFGDSVVYSAVNLNLSVVFNYKDENGDVSVTKTVTPYDPLGKYVFYPNGYMDVEYEYTFEKWVFITGEEVNFLNITDGKKDKDIVNVYAKYNKKKRKYAVVYRYGNEEFLPDKLKNSVILRAETEYGRKPEVPTPSVDDDGDYMFVFGGYDREITAVSGDAEYIAKFSRMPIAEIIGGEIFSITDRGGVVRISADYSVLDKDKKTEIRIFDAAARAAQREMPLAICLNDVEAIIDRTDVKAIASSNYGAILSVRIIMTSVAGANKYTVITSVKNTNGADIAIDDRRIGSTVTIRGVNIDFVGGKLSFTDGDSGEAADNFTYNFEEKKFVYRAESGIYVLAAKYGVSVFSECADALTISAECAYAGEAVTYRVKEKSGYTANVYYYDGDVKITVDSGSFFMPPFGVLLHCDYTKIMYNVRFLYEKDGQKIILLEKRYPFGSILGVDIIAPAPPPRYSDDEFTYSFSGWSRSIGGELTSDIEFVAEYSRAPIEKENIKKGGWFSGKTAIISISAITVVVLGGAAAAFAILKKKKRKK